MKASFFDYYYGLESEQYNFFRIPKLLFTDKRFRHVSSDAKILYGIMLDRMNLSRKNGWIDDKNRVYIIFSINEIMETLGCAEQKAVKLLAELDLQKGIGLIEKKRQGQGKPSLIYVKNFISENIVSEEKEDKIESCDNHNSKTMKNTILKLRKSQSNNINNNDTEISIILSEVKKQIRYEELIRERGGQKQKIELIVSVMREIYDSKADNMSINKAAVSTVKVKEVYRKISKKGVEYVLDNMEMAGDITYPKRFIITALYNASKELDNNNKQKEFSAGDFHLFEQRNYDFDIIEKSLLGEDSQRET